MSGSRGSNAARPLSDAAFDRNGTSSEVIDRGQEVGSSWLAFFRLVLYGLLTIGLLPLQVIALAFWPALARAVPRAHHWLAARIIGLRVRQEGAAVVGPPVLFVCNHVSYFDIIALGSIVPASFVAKGDVAGWPVFGFLARLCRTIFVDRRSKDPRGQIDILRARLNAPDSLVVFPEGTSSDGSRVLPFKSTLFAAVEGTSILVQPISIHYRRLNGIPMGRAYRPFYAWFGDMDLAPHLWAALSLGAVEIAVRFHAPVVASDFSDRKGVAAHCHGRIASGVGADAN